MHEKKMWPHSCYVTLTYNNESLPPGGSISLRDVQLFMKRLRKKKKANKDNPIRFFLGAEYGEENGRPHYHALLFNCAFRDMVYFGRNKRGEPLYTSRELSDLWSCDGKTLGHCTIGEVTFDSAVYCAKYAIKKISGEAALEHYQVYDESGEVFQRRPEFAVMSRNPGLGAAFFDKYQAEIINNDSVIIDGREVRPPRYYDDRAAKRDFVPHDEKAVLCGCKVCVNKRARKRKAVSNRADNTDDRLQVKERLMVIAAEKKERSL